ncbi:MAG: DUF1059 domain-containing protein [Chloroflexota bacterium]|nr:DUF1059 domain-containing protein [Chloroflexota bacterium]
MIKVVNCRDVGFDCDGVVRAKTEDEALRKVAEHARTVHGMEHVPDEVVQKVQRVMRDEEE